MIFGSFNCSDAEGIILAHTTKTKDGKLKKGISLTQQQLKQLRCAGHHQVMGAQLAEDDIHEDVAAMMLATRLAGKHTRIGKAVGGRCRIYATQAGITQINRSLIDSLNLLGGDIAIATLNEFATTERDQALASIKVIPFAIAAHQMQAYLQLTAQHQSGIALAPYQPLNVVLIQTQTPESTNSTHTGIGTGLRTSNGLQNRARRVIQQRIEFLGGTLLQQVSSHHDVTPLSDVMAQVIQPEVDLVLIIGSTATVDRFDVIPQAINNCGGTIVHFGMPVEPGNLLLLGQHGHCPIVIVPGCARAVHANGLDLILPRLFAKLPITQNTIMTMGVGGLIKDQKEPQDWAGPDYKQSSDNQPSHKHPNPKPRIAAIILAAGRSTRMAANNKLLVPIAGQPMVSHVVAAAKNSNLDSITVVTGHDSEHITQLLADDETLNFVFNPDYANGMATSLRRGLSAINDDYDAVMVLLGDMPFVSSALIDRLLQSFDPSSERDIVAPLHGERRGNPVLWSIRYLEQLMAIDGDKGGRDLLNKYDQRITLVSTSDDGSIIDIDTPETLLQWQQPALETINPGDH